MSSITVEGRSEKRDPIRSVVRRVRSRAPLRLGLAGGGTDVSPYCDLYGGIVLNATIGRYCYATIEPAASGLVEFCAPDISVIDVDSPDGVRTTAGRLALHRACYRRICEDFNLGSPSLRVTTVSDAPPGSGLGSSSTLVVAVVEAFREYFSLPLGEYDVARLAFQIERRDSDLQGGRQDQYAATFGGFNVMEFGAQERVIVNPLRIKSAIVRELEASIVLFDSGHSRQSASIIGEQTGHIAEGDERRIAATHALKDEAFAMKEALLTGDFEALATILNRGWRAKKQLASGITNRNIEEAFDAALGAGATAGKVSGAGGGGYVLFLVDPVCRPQVIRSLGEIEASAVQPVHFVDEGAAAWSFR
jgi:D-glycero-alpha-D-manno-heptose-7-phosphate kinase